MTKNEIIADETLFQRVCDAYVRRHIGPCVSSLMYDVGQNLEACSKIFDFDYDEALGWFQVPDYEAAVDDLIDDADLDDLETIAETVGDWDVLINGIIGVSEEEYEEETGLEYSDHLEANIRQIRSKVKAMITNDAEYREISEHFNLEPDYNEIYEYWNIDSNWFADELKKYGQVVFEFGGLTIWGRMTTGQAISIDGVIRRMVRDLSEDHWVWREA